MDVVASLQQLAALVARMVELARERHWQQLPELDAQCTTLVQQLRDADAGHLSTTERAHTLEMASRIRAGQEELESLTRPQFRRLVRRMDVLRRLDAQ